MAARVSTRLSRGDGRRFGFTVGAALVALAGLVTWRGHPLGAWVLLGLGGALCAAAWWVPARLGPVYRFWMALSVAISGVTTPVFMGFIYFVIVTPIGLLRRLTGHNPLARPGTRESLWVARDAGARRRTDMEHLF